MLDGKGGTGAATIPALAGNPRLAAGRLSDPGGADRARRHAELRRLPHARPAGCGADLCAHQLREQVPGAGRRGRHRGGHGADEEVAPLRRVRPPSPWPPPSRRPLPRRSCTPRCTDPRP
ncbi:MAG: hypothetical protein WDN45_06575 [Caulobacteraceae bacterium]